ncbi:hypothetical protein [Massilia sp. TSP1-1-2]|uniref:hypothetical protein n=1 Tax=Massilia sp. TSP1-1-2 TaxID=2804649 RepID=UPI003CE6841E
MNSKKFCVDFNEMVEGNLVLFSADDTKRDTNGELVVLYEGMEVTVFMEDLDEIGNRDDLVASGRLELNVSDDWSRHVKWCCRIDENDIRNESDF